MSRLTKWDPVRECYVIEPDSTQNHIQRLGELEDKAEPKNVYAKDDGERWFCPGCDEELELEDYENPYCKFCGQRLKWGD